MVLNKCGMNLHDFRFVKVEAIHASDIVNLNFLHFHCIHTFVSAVVSPRTETIMSPTHILAAKRSHVFLN